MNKVILVGNLVKDMEVKTVKNFDIGRFTLAVNEGYGDNQKTYFIPCSIFGERVENLQKYLLKGVKVLVDGSIYYENYKDNEEWKSLFNVTVGNIEILKFADIEEKNTNKNKRGRK